MHVPAVSPVLLLAVGLIASQTLALLPAADNVRLDLRAKDIDLDAVAITEGKGTVRESVWLGEALKKQGRYLQFSIPKSTWTKLAFTFTVATDSEVTFLLSGPDRRQADGTTRIPVLVTYDQVEAAGATVKNGGFETLDPNGFPLNWWKSKEDQGLSKVATEGAREGSKAMVAWHDGKVGQKLKCTANSPVTISLYAYSEVDPATK